MRARMRPSGRQESVDEPSEEPVIINMAMDEAEEAGANARSPSPEIEHIEVEEAPMDEAEKDLVYVPPESQDKEPDREPDMEIRVLNAYYTQGFKPKQVYSPSSVSQVTSKTGKTQEEEALEEDVGRQIRQEQEARGRELPSSGARGDSPRSRSQDAVCGCEYCKKKPGRAVSPDTDQDRSGSRRVRARSTWTPEARSRSPSARPDGPRFGGSSRCGDQLWEAMKAEAKRRRSRSRLQVRGAAGGESEEQMEA